MTWINYTLPKVIKFTLASLLLLDSDVIVDDANYGD